MPIEYREPPFNRVWVATDPRRPFRTTYGLDYKRRTCQVEVHIDTPPGGLEFSLREVADIVMDDVRFLAQMRAERE